MKLILIRGVPGTGKTKVANILGQILQNSQVIHVDNFKVKAMKKGKTFKEAQEIAYDDVLDKLGLFQDKKHIILEEIVCDKTFWNRINRFYHESKADFYGFRLLRKIDELLEVESQRKRKVKNTKEDFSKLKQDIESLKVPREHLIKNDNLTLTIKKILDVLLKI
ncbi:MAG: hypothetical protein V1788_01280 [Nanoarchaeota archaeon]